MSLIVSSPSQFPRRRERRLRSMAAFRRGETTMADTPNTPAANDPQKKAELKDIKEIEKQAKTELKDFKEIEKLQKENIKAEIKDIKEVKLEKVEIKEHKDTKIEKLEKNENKEHKDAKHEKIEKNEFKEHKDAKNEKTEKNEIKEHKEGTKIEQKEFKVEQKETFKIESPEKTIGKEKDGKEIAEIGNGDPGGPVEQRLSSLEQNVSDLQHFISTGQRPDLSRGALTGEPGGAAAPAPAPKGKTP
jgi:hypothetical protein